MTPPASRWPIWRPVLEGLICSTIIAAAAAVAILCLLTPDPI